MADRSLKYLPIRTREQIDEAQRNGRLDIRPGYDNKYVLNLKLMSSFDEFDKLTSVNSEYRTKLVPGIKMHESITTEEEAVEFLKDHPMYSFIGGDTSLDIISNVGVTVLDILTRWAVSKIFHTVGIREHKFEDREYYTNIWSDYHGVYFYTQQIHLLHRLLLSMHWINVSKQLRNNEMIWIPMVAATASTGFRMNERMTHKFAFFNVILNHSRSQNTIFLKKEYSTLDPRVKLKHRDPTKVQKMRGKLQNPRYIIRHAIVVEMKWTKFALSKITNGEYKEPEGVNLLEHLVAVERLHKSGYSIVKDFHESGFRFIYIQVGSDGLPLFSFEHTPVPNHDHDNLFKLVKGYSKVEKEKASAKYEKIRKKIKEEKEEARRQEAQRRRVIVQTRRAAGLNSESDNDSDSEVSSSSSTVIAASVATAATGQSYADVARKAKS